MANSLLPIGSIVLLKDSEVRVMIAGYMAITQSKKDYVWDYSGFRFPIGYVRDDEILCFDNEQIEDVVQFGFMNYEWQEFIQKIEEVADQVKQEISKTEEE